MKINSIVAFIDDIKKSLQNNCYYSALVLALTLPDIIGKVMYPEIIPSSVRYIKWFDKYIGDTEKPIISKEYESLNDLPYINGEICYNLRCALIHQGENNLEDRRIESYSLDEFTLIVEKQNDFDIYCDTSSEDGNGYRKYEIQIRNLCNKIIWSIEAAIRRKEIDFDNMPHLNILVHD